MSLSMLVSKSLMILLMNSAWVLTLDFASSRDFLRVFLYFSKSDTAWCNSVLSFLDPWTIASAKSLSLFAWSSNLRTLCVLWEAFMHSPQIIFSHLMQENLTSSLLHSHCIRVPPGRSTVLGLVPEALLDVSPSLLPLLPLRLWCPLPAVLSSLWLLPWLPLVTLLIPTAWISAEAGGSELCDLW